MPGNLLRISQLRGAFVNARGRCGGKAAMQALQKALYDLDHRSLVVGVAEADARRAAEEESYDFHFYRKHWAVRRKRLEGGRALKIFIAKELEDCIDSVHWLRRSVVLRFHTSIESHQIIFSHFAHGDSWEDSVQELMPWLLDASWRSLVVGDLNVESRFPYQTSDERERWHNMLESFESANLTFHDTDLEFTRRSDDPNLCHSKLDHCFADSRFNAAVTSSWDGAPGDHAWILFGISFKMEWRKQPPRRWNCDWAAFESDMGAGTPSSFPDWHRAEAWLVSMVEKHASKCSRRERRQEWEPLFIKELRRQIRVSTSDLQRNLLSKRLYVARKQWYEQRESVHFKALVAKGRNPSKPNKLYPVTDLCKEGEIVHSLPELVHITEHEFAKRWQALPDDLAAQRLEEDVSLEEFAITADDLWEAAKRIKRPWMRDCRGLPPAAFLGNLRFMQAALPNFKALLGCDRAWAGLTEQGYTKQKVAGGKDPSKLRGIIPNSSILRLLTNVVLGVVQPYANVYSREHGLDAAVLGASKGGQTLDIAHTAQLCLMCGREDMDRSAIGHMDIRNFHDSISWSHMFQCQMRRKIPPAWMLAAIRLQRCPEVHMMTRGALSAIIPRSRGALTGNRLAPWFGRIVVEDVLLASERHTQRLNYEIMGTALRPMAWSDNIVVCGRSARGVAKSLGSIADVLALHHLRVKDDSCEIVPSCSRRLRWSSIQHSGLTFSVSDETKLLGFWITCNGDPSRNKATMLGGLRGKLAVMDKRFRGVPRAARAKWWQLQFRGYVAYFAAFIGCNRGILRSLASINNDGARKILGVSRRYNVGHELTRVQTEFKICVQTFFCASIVSYVGHCFRHREHAVSKLMSLPLPERLENLRLQGRRIEPSGPAQATRSFLVNLGLELGQLVGGLPNSRGHSGMPFRWGESWFFEIRDYGPGWNFQKVDKKEVELRAKMLLDIFWFRFRQSSLLPIQDAVLQIADT